MDTMKKRLRRLVTDARGKTVIGQPLNGPAKVGGVSALLAVVTPDDIRTVAALTAYGAWFTWAWLELFEGVTPLRRITGGFVLAVLLTLGLLFAKGLGV